MRFGTMLSWRRTTCCVLVSVAGAALADERPRGLQGDEKVTVSFQMLTTFAGGATSPMHVLNQDLAVGEAMVSDAMNGHEISMALGGDPSGCSARMAVQSAESQMEDHAVAWSADAKLLEASTDALVLSVNWRRFERGGDSRPVEAASEQIPRLSLREGQRVLLDLARLEGSRCFHNGALEMTVKVKEDAYLAGEQIAYDLWLVQRTEDGKQTSARTQLTGGQGQDLQFAFPKQEVPARASGGRADDRLQVAFTGHVRGRIRRDGSIDLSLRSERMLSYVAKDGSNDGGFSDGGEKLVRVKPGDAIRVEIPGPAQGPGRGDARALRMAQDLAGHSFALIVTAKAL